LRKDAASVSAGRSPSFLIETLVTPEVASRPVGLTTKKSRISPVEVLCPAGRVVIITTLRTPEPFVTPFLSLLGTAALVAAPVEPGAGDKAGRYQKIADGLAWKEPADQPQPSLSAQVSDYLLEIHVTISGGERTEAIAVTDRGRVLCSWQERGHCVCLVRNGTLYRAEYDQISSGCAIVAVNLKPGKEIWKATLQGLGPIDHSKYRNRVWMESVDDLVFAIYGHESAGRYVELVDWKSGKTLGHKVFPRE